MEGGLRICRLSRSGVLLFLVHGGVVRGDVLVGFLELFQEDGGADQGGDLSCRPKQRGWGEKSRDGTKSRAVNNLLPPSSSPPGLHQSQHELVCEKKCAAIQRLV